MAENKLRRFLDTPKSAETTLLSESIRFNGDFQGDGNMVVTGIVEGNCDINGTFTLALGGQWSGTIKASQIVIAGSVSGDVEAVGQLEVAATAKIQGDVAGATIAVAQGAVIEGSMHINGGDDAKSFQEKRKKR